jgi:hypothetical protein
MDVLLIGQVARLQSCVIYIDVAFLPQWAMATISWRLPLKNRMRAGKSRFRRRNLGSGDPFLLN